jgi:ATP-dependent helicase/nuclease subunit B
LSHFGSVSAASVVVPNSIVARQWVARIATSAPWRDHQAWLGPQVMTYRAWTRSLWQQSAATSSLLSSTQSEGLWQRIVAESEQGRGLLNVDSIARAAKEAWGALRAAGIEPSAVNALGEPGETPDFIAFLEWARLYRETLQDKDWIDEGDLEISLPGVGGWQHERQTVFADLGAETRGQQAFLAHLRSLGWTVEPPPAEQPAIVAKIGLPDASSELRTAVLWLRAQLEADRTARVALVVPDLDDREPEVLHALEACQSESNGSARASSWALLAGERTSSKPLISAAMGALELFSPTATFATLSRWLRSPFFCRSAEERASRAMLEVALRTRITTQLGFLDAYRRAGLRELLAERAPAVNDSLALAMRCLAGVEARQTPTRWVRTWSEMLRLLGWQGGDADTHAVEQVLGWEQSLQAFAELTPVVGSVDWTWGWQKLARLQQRRLWHGGIPVEGIFVVEHLEDLGPGYAAIWVSGATARRWPRPHVSPPLLPATVAARAGVHAVAREGLTELARVCQAGRSVVLSWPARERDIPCGPSPLLGEIQDLGGDAIARGSGRRAWSTARYETIVDPAPRLASPAVPGGSRTLALQARCPLVAFCEQRLGARPLARIGNGLTREQRGIAAHVATQELLRRLPGQAALQSDAGRVAAEIASSVEIGLGRVFGTARKALAGLFSLEEEQLGSILERLVGLELSRAPFVVVALESERSLDVGGRRLVLRIDRVDRLADGTLAVIDYKTGTPPRPIDWLAEPPRDPQVPAYAIAVGDLVEAAVVVSLRSSFVGYRGFWSGSSFPGSPQALPRERAWSEQIERWRQGIAQLIEQFAAGDVRVFRDAWVDAGGPLSPLTRIFEQEQLGRDV